MNPTNYEEYLNYQATDFVLDLSFQQWAQGKKIPFWDNFKDAHPEKEDAIQEALHLIGQLSTQDQPLPPAYTQAQLAAVYRKIEQRTHEQEINRPRYRIPPFWYAASVILLLLAGGLFYFFSNHYSPVYQTAYQETQTIQLADGTEVTLNSNSRLRVAPDLSHQSRREVWLEGEAFFNVSRSPRLDGFRQFIVHTPLLDVEVLGTVFNVKSRSDNTQVLLEEGSVKVARPETQEHLLMNPGEVVEVDAMDQKIRKRQLAEPTPLAWRENAFDFRNATLASVARQISDYYGKEIQFSHPEIANYQFTARVSRDDLDLLLSLIESAFSVQATVQNDTIMITKE